MCSFFLCRGLHLPPGVQRQLAMGFATPRKKAAPLRSKTLLDGFLMHCVWEDNDEEKQKQDAMLSEVDPCKAWRVESTTSLHQKDQQRVWRFSWAASVIEIVKRRNAWRVLSRFSWPEWSPWQVGDFFSQWGLVTLVYRDRASWQEPYSSERMVSASKRECKLGQPVSILDQGLRAFRHEGSCPPDTRRKRDAQLFTRTS